MDKLHHAPDARVDTFVHSFLRRDGLFIIRLVAKNASDLIAAELICGLWEHFRDHKRQLERLESTTTPTDLNLITDNIQLTESQTWQLLDRIGRKDDDDNPPNGPLAVITAQDGADSNKKRPVLQKSESIDETEPNNVPLFPTAPPAEEFGKSRRKSWERMDEDREKKMERTHSNRQSSVAGGGAGRMGAGWFRRSQKDNKGQSSGPGSGSKFNRVV